MITITPVVMTGVFGRAAEEFIAYKRDQGYKYYSEEKVLGRFCRFAEERGIRDAVITKELAMDWIAPREGDVRLSSPTVIRLTGKGRKSRLVPIMARTEKLLRSYLDEYDPDYTAHESCPLFCNRDGKKLTRAGISYILKKYVLQAQSDGGIPTQTVVSPHVLRHSKAMHLLQSGVNLVYIRDLLGHADISTTEIYARADEHLKRKALMEAYPSPSPESETPAWQKDSDLLSWLKSLGK